MDETPLSPSKWAPDEIRRFYRAYHKYGSDFFKVSKMVGGGKAPEMCAGLLRRHQAYLSLDKKFQSEVAFVALVQDGGASHGGAQGENDETEDDGGIAGLAGPVGGGADSGLTGAEDSDDDLGVRYHDGVNKSEEEGGVQTTGLASPGKDGTMLASRPRRTPKRGLAGSPGGKASPSAGKRSRGGGRGVDDDIYEYYDEGANQVTESAKKRRLARQRLDLDGVKEGGSAAGAGDKPPKRRETNAEKRGIDALLSLAVAGESDEGVSEEEEEDALGMGLDDDKDEDYRAGARERSRRTPHNTPHKTRNRPLSAHLTPPRGGLLSPAGLRGAGSPGWGGMDDDLLGDLTGGDGISFLASPGMPTHIPPGFIPSPKNPMPRLRRRKAIPERLPSIISPIKSLFGRRQTLVGAPTLLALGGLGFPGVAQQDEISPDATVEERAARHALSSGLRRWCMFEFFYSTVDRPFFMDTTMADLTVHVGLPPGCRLTRKEWAALRSSLGRPRRLSWSFLRDCRAMLESHRRSVREVYCAPNFDPNMAPGMPRPVEVGQRVVARHPATRQLHDGSVLTTAHDSYRVQFDRRELGVEVVRDIHVMPLEPWDNLPLTMLATRPRLVLAGRLILNGRVVPLPKQAAASAAGAAGGAAGSAAAPAQPSLPQMLPPASARPGAPDPASMAELATNLDRKEALLVQLRQMNEEAANGVHNDPITGQPSAAFLQAYESVAGSLKDVNDAVQAKLTELERGVTGAATPPELAGLANPDASTLPPELLSAPITAPALAAAAKREAERVTRMCWGRMAGTVGAQQTVAAAAGAGAGGAAEGQQQGGLHPGGPVGPLIEGAVWTLTLLQQGADRLVPASVLANALDSSLLSVKPTSVVNAGLYTEIEMAMNNLKLQLLAQI